jgi:hypothetical protein
MPLIYIVVFVSCLLLAIVIENRVKRLKRVANAELTRVLLHEFPDPQGIWWEGRHEEINDLQHLIEAKYGVVIDDFELVWPNGASVKISYRELECSSVLQPCELASAEAQIDRINRSLP